MIRTKLKKHQLLAVKFCVSIYRKLGIFYTGFFSDFGTGKSLMFLAVCEVLKFKKVLLVSSKTSIETTWPREIQKHSDYNWMMLLSKTNGVKDRLRNLQLGLRRCGSVSYGYGDVTVFLINFEGLRNEVMAKALINAKFDVMCIDESTKIKDPNAERTKWAWAIGSKIHHKDILTGFPSTEGIHELYSQIKYMDGGKALGNSYWGFQNKLFVKYGTRLFPHKTAVKWIIKWIIL